MITMIKNLFKTKPTVYFTSDLHFGHRNVINYCNRPYKDIEEMHKGLITIWNNTVKQGDTVYVLGDFSLNPKWSGQMLPLLKGNKILIPGNHDACFNFPPKENTTHAIEGAKRRHDKMLERYIKDGWKSIHQTLTYTLKDGRTVLLSHLPYNTEEGREYDQRYLDLRPKDEGMFLLCGHLHGKFIKNINMIDVGIDAHDLQLVSEDDIIRLINDDREYIPSSLTEWYEKNRNNKSKEY